MGLFTRKKRNFIPDLKKSEYDNWLAFLDTGGTSTEWSQLKSKNRWVFAESAEEKFERYQREVKSVANKYYAKMQEIEKSWSVLYNLGEYTGDLAKKLEKDCLANIESYKKMLEIDKKYGEKTPTNIPAIKRLAMLYEKQGKFNEAVEICKIACSFGMDERSRMARMIKKLKRLPTNEENTYLLKNMS